MQPKQLTVSEMAKSIDEYFDWVEKKGDDGLREYVKEKNLKSLDGLRTDIGLKKERDSS